MKPLKTREECECGHLGWQHTEIACHMRQQGKIPLGPDGWCPCKRPREAGTWK